MAAPFRGTRPPLSCLSLLLGALLLGGPSPAATAQGPEHAPPAEALAHYQRARQHYAHGRYRQAAEALRRARRLDPRSPTLAFNLARVHELLGELDEAIAAYRTYLELLPDSEQTERDRVRGVLVRLQGARQQVQRSNAEPSSAPPTRPPKPLEMGPGARYVERHVVDTPVWALLGLGAAGLLAGSVTGGVALARRGDVERFVLGLDGTQRDRDAIETQRAGWALAADVSFGAAAAALIGATLLYVLRTETWEQLPSGVERPVERTDGETTR